MNDNTLSRRSLLGGAGALGALLLTGLGEGTAEALGRFDFGPIHHFGLVVKHPERTTRQLHRALGMDFTDEIVSSFDIRREDGSVQSVTSHTWLAQTAAPRLEIEGEVPGTPLEVQHGIAIGHIAFELPPEQIATASAALSDAGLVRAATINDPSIPAGQPRRGAIGFAYHYAKGGFFVELISAGVLPPPPAGLR